MGARQLKVGLRVADLDRSCALYLRLGFRQIPGQDQPNLRYLTFGHTWLILSDLHRHGYHDAEREQAVKAGPVGQGFVLAVPTPDLTATYELWRAEGLPVTLEPEDVGWARIFYGLDPDGYEVMFEEFTVAAPDER
ncbi:VOC family protein [Micromonospora cathayae]|uniref:VOC family protein n=1 Tax=Micromonospora cathayae TaxID=3028804 RepID=A0ABY8A1Z9_9ACTN|nr:VOC family protein [Micromonospora sp. HUAS 3]WDZ88238.1 VOC family protein [Micromonospora sp. HUAS 3]